MYSQFSLLFIVMFIFLAMYGIYIYIYIWYMVYISITELFYPSIENKHCLFTGFDYFPVQSLYYSVWNEMKWNLESVKVNQIRRRSDNVPTFKIMH